jgi:hypothetical protein
MASERDVESDVLALMEALRAQEASRGGGDHPEKRWEAEVALARVAANTLVDLNRIAGALESIAHDMADLRNHGVRGRQ